MDFRKDAFLEKLHNDPGFCQQLKINPKKILAEYGLHITDYEAEMVKKQYAEPDFNRE